MYNNLAVILAGGKGTRIKSINKPKQYIEINNKPILVYTIEAFHKLIEIDAIVVVCTENYVEYINTIIDTYNLNKVKKIIIGGKNRQDSSYNALKSIKNLVYDDSTILIHDVARPLVSSKIILENIKMVQKYNATITAIPSYDSILETIDKTTLLNVVDRNRFFLIQTPQSFKYSKITYAYDMAMKNDCLFTDDSSLYMKYVKEKVMITLGSKLNFKITTDEDIYFLTALLDFNYHNL